MVRKPKINKIFYLDDISSLFAEGKLPNRIQILKIGKWNHPIYGKFEITLKDLELFKKNFDDDVRKIELALDTEHYSDKGAAAWFKELVIEDSALYAEIEWTDWGKEAVKKKLFKYISPEFEFKYKDAETGDVFQNVLFGAALTNRPFIKGMEPVLLSERVDMSSNTYPFYNLETEKEEEMKLKDLLELIGLKEDAVEADVKKLMEGLKANKLVEISKALGLDENAEVKDITAKLKEVAEDYKKKLAEAKKENEGKVTLTEAEVKILREKADNGQKALDQLKLKEITDAVDAAIKAGKVVPAQKEHATKMAEKDLEGFKKFIENAPKVVNFTEEGREGDDRSMELKEKIDKLTDKKLSENKGMKYSDALKEVLGENEDLAKEYDNQ